MRTYEVTVMVPGSIVPRYRRLLAYSAADAIVQVELELRHHNIGPHPYVAEVAPCFEEIGLRVKTVYGRAQSMNIDRGTENLIDTQKVLLSIAGKDAGGVVHGIPADQFVWVSSDPKVIELDTSDTDATGATVPLDPYTRIAHTPTPGSAVVTVTGPDGNSETLTIVVANSGPGEIGLSAGTPTPE